MTLRTLSLWLALCLLVAAPAGAHAQAGPSTSLTLVIVPLPDASALNRYLSADVPAYARLFGDEGEYVLAGADAAGLDRLSAAGLPARILDSDAGGAAYFVVYPAPGSAQIDWSSYGRLLLDDGRQVLLRASSEEIARLRREKVEVTQVTLDAKPLRRERLPAQFSAIPSVTQSDPLVQAMIDQVDQDTAVQYVGDLSGEWPVTIEGAPYTITSRYTLGGTPVGKATRYVGEHLDGLGLDVEYHTYKSNWPPNVIGELAGAVNPADIFIIGGHLDDMPSSGLAPGADDNASGSVGALVAADILSQYEWGCTLRFVFWTGEEQGLLGSDAYAKRASNRSENILGVLNLDMIGWNTSNSPANIDLHANASLPATVDLAQLFADVVDLYGINLIPEIYPDGATASDHASFWNYGYTAILGIEDYRGSPGDFNPFYHSSSDLLAKLDKEYFTDFVRAAVGSMAHMSNCLRTGQLQGQVLASHDGSPIVDATVMMTRTVGYDGAAVTDSAGAYSAIVPSGLYDVTAAAYGYLPVAVNNVSVAGGATASEGFSLAAAAPQAPAIASAISLDGAAVTLTWSHSPPNMAYQVHRSASPYFVPDDSTWRADRSLPFPDPIVYEDTASGLGNPEINHFYVVLGVNAAGATAPSNRTGEFDFTLTPGG